MRQQLFSPLGLHKILRCNALRGTFAILWLLAINCASAAGGPTVADAWIRWLPGNGPLAGYFELRNDATQAITLKAARSPAFSRIMIHRSVLNNGQASMRPVIGGVRIAAGDKVIFAPGDYHLMLMQRRADLKVGDQAPITFFFDHRDSITVQFRVRPPTTQ